MAGAKTTSRQKLINMMYLVLTALLALNISKEVLDSFITIDEGQLRSRFSIEEDLSNRFQTFSDYAADKPLKFAAPFAHAEEIHHHADELVRHIDRIKATCIAETEGLAIEEVYDPLMDTVLAVEHVQRKDDYTVTTNVLYGTQDLPATDARPGDSENLRAVELRKRIEGYIGLVREHAPGTEAAHALGEVFDFADRPDADGDMRSWEQINFYNVPLAAVQSILSKMQMDIRTAELGALDHLFDGVEGKAMKFTRLREAVIPVTNNVSMGGVFLAEVFLAAYDDTNPPEIRLAEPDAHVDDAQLEIIGDYIVLPVDSNMMGSVALPAASLGGQHREGIIIFKPAGLPEVRKKFTLDYTVSAPTAIVNPINMNVLYKGVDNPLAIGVPGYRAEDITARIDNGALSRQRDGTYTAKLSQGNTAQVSLSVTLPDGTVRSLAPVPFRVKSVPDPVAYFGGKSAKDNRINKADLIASQGVRVEMDGFLFPVTFRVESFEIVASVNGRALKQGSSSNRTTAEQKTIIEAMRSGQKVSIENIYVRGPAGERRKLANINLTVN